MSQRRMSLNVQQEIHAPFRIKSAGVSLFVILMIGMYYIANLINLLPSEEAIPEGALGLMIVTSALTIVVEVALQTVLVIGAGRIEDRSENDGVVVAKASRNASYVLAVGAFATVASMFAGFTQFEMASVLIGAFLLAETVGYASQLVYYRKNA